MLQVGVLLGAAQALTALGLGLLLVVVALSELAGPLGLDLGDALSLGLLVGGGLGVGLGLGLLEGPGLDGDCTVLELAFPKVIRTSLNSLRAPNSFSYSAKGSFESKM